jgi:hypothetical protein
MRIVWDRAAAEIRDVLTPYLDLGKVVPDYREITLSYVAVLMRNHYLLAALNSKEWLFYSYETILGHVVSRAGETALNTILTSLDKTWADVYLIVDENRIADFLCRYNPNLEEVARVFAMARAGAVAAPSLLLQQIRS